MSRRTAGAILASLIVLLMSALPASGQSTPAPIRNAFWVGVGLGAGSEDFAGSLNGSSHAETRRRGEAGRVSPRLRVRPP